MSTKTPAWINHIRLFIRNVFHAAWLFSPGILVLVATAICFWNLLQGKDIMLLAIQRRWFFALFIGTLFFLVIVSWYGARMVSDAKKKIDIEGPPGPQGSQRPGTYGPQGLKRPQGSQDSQEPQGPLPYLSPYFYTHTPRFIGFSFFTVIILAFAQLPIFRRVEIPGWENGFYFLLFVLSFPYYHFMSSYIKRKFKHIAFNKLFYILISIIIIGSLVLSISLHKFRGAIFAVLLLLQWCYLIFVITRRRWIESKMNKKPTGSSEKPQNATKNAGIEQAEVGFHRFFFSLSVLFLAIYIACTVSISVSVRLGSFSFVLLAFAILLGIGFLLSYISIRVGFNVHFIFVLLAFAFGLWTERHRVDLLDSTETMQLGQRDSFQEYFNKWVRLRQADIDSASEYPVYFVLADGGASRSGYWVASVLSKLQDTSRNSFGRHLFCLSGASGGSVGNASFYLLLKRLGDTPSRQPYDSVYLKHSRQYLESDFLTYTLSRMLSHDFFVQVLPYDTKGDRAKALALSLESAPTGNTFLEDSINMRTPFSHLISRRSDPNSASLPILCINTTRMQDGRPSVISTVALDAQTFNNRLDVLTIIPKEKDIKLSTAVVLGASFPYISPAGRIDQPDASRKNGIREHYFVDGGYVDNSGAGVVHEMLIKLQQLKTAALNGSGDQQSKDRLRKLRFYVLHISNGPTGEAYIKKVNPFINDLAAPLQTLAGSYSVQTTINDSRLKNFMTGISPDSYWDLNLYRPRETIKYSMNWVISRTTLDSMDQRLRTHENIFRLIARLPKK